ncbi:hypothetical protein WME99_44735 [Sorangium sp. So ce136]|uniref:hypothetical protein n=1 Tax=Sorangium sp. So ce136 TaxID=3133284 RepID=UPI003EFF8486
MANVLPMETRVRIAAALVEGTSVRAVERMTGVAKSTILRFAVDLGEGCARLHNRLVQGLCEPDIELDEQWSFIAKKDKRVTEEDPAEFGDVFTYTAFAKRSKLVISYAVGKRDQATTDAFLADLRARELVVPQITSDGLTLYVPAVEASFRGCVDYGMVVKQYGHNESPDHKCRAPFSHTRPPLPSPHPRCSSARRSAGHHFPSPGGTTRRARGRRGRRAGWRENTTEWRVRERAPTALRVHILTMIARRAGPCLTAAARRPAAAGRRRGTPGRRHNEGVRRPC